MGPYIIPPKVNLAQPTKAFRLTTLRLLNQLITYHCSWRARRDSVADHYEGAYAFEWNTRFEIDWTGPKCYSPKKCIFSLICTRTLIRCTTQNSHCSVMIRNSRRVYIYPCCSNALGLSVYVKLRRKIPENNQFQLGTRLRLCAPKSIRNSSFHYLAVQYPCKVASIVSTDNEQVQLVSLTWKTTEKMPNLLPKIHWPSATLYRDHNASAMIRHSSKYWLAYERLAIH